MKYGLTETTVEKICAVFARFPEIEKAVLYGSRAKGNFKTGSDIDLTLCGEALTSDLRSTIASALDDLLLPYTIDLSVFNELNHAKLREHIERVGALFYQRAKQGSAIRRGWETKKLGDLCEIELGKTPARANKMFWDEKRETENVWLSIADLLNAEDNIVVDSKEYLSDKGAAISKTVRKGTLLASFKLTLGRLAFAGRDLFTNEAIAALTIFNERTLSKEFLFYFLHFFDWRKAAENDVKLKGMTLNKAKLKELYVHFPTPPEQQRIVGILNKAFEGIVTAKANAEKNLQNARALFESYLQVVFSQRGEGWKQKTLEEVATTFGRGKSRHRPRNAKHLYGGKYPFIQTGDIRNADHLITEYSQTYSEAGLAQSKLWPKGTICITIAANIAETGILDFDACFPDSVIGVVTNPKEADVGFVEYLLQSFKARLQAMGKGSAQANINMGTFENERFPFPSVAEQRRIVARLDSLSDETQRLELIYQQKLTALEALKKSLLHQAFTGEL